MEECYGLGCSSCIGGRTASGSNRNFPWCAAAARSVHSSGRARCVCIPLEPVGFGVGYGVDMGAVGSNDGLACAVCGDGGPHLGRGCILIAQATVVALVVGKQRQSEDFGHHSYTQ